MCVRVCVFNAAVHSISVVMLPLTAVVLVILAALGPTALPRLQNEVHWKTLQIVESFLACWKEIAYRTSGSCRSQWNYSRYLQIPWLSAGGRRPSCTALHCDGGGDCC